MNPEEITPEARKNRKPKITKRVNRALVRTKISSLEDDERVEFDDFTLTLGRSLHSEDACTEPCDARPSQLAEKDMSKTTASGMKQTSRYIPDMPFHSTKSSAGKQRGERARK